MADRPKANLRDQVAYEAGLLQAQACTLARAFTAKQEGRTELHDELVALSEELTVERKKSEQWRLESL